MAGSTRVVAVSLPPASPASSNSPKIRKLFAAGGQAGRKSGAVTKDRSLRQYFLAGHRATLAFGSHEVLARDAEPHHERGHDERRRVNAEADADCERQREVMQGFAAEEEDRQHHEQRRSVRDD